VADIVVAYDPEQPAGERLAPEVIAEIQLVAPNDVQDGAITSTKLAAGAVEEANIAAGAVGSPELANGAVNAAALASGAVTSGKIAAGAVGFAAAGAGVATAEDSSSNPIALRFVPITAALYAGLTTPDPNTIYLIDG
jgi:hypothetical protein